MSHPARVNLPCPGEPRSGVGPQAPAHSCTTQSGGRVIPLANSPFGQCVNGVGYRQKENGAYGWSSTQNNTVVYVEYWWCPAVNSAQYPSGINWAYGTARPASGCYSDLAVGQLVVVPSNPVQLGARTLGTGGQDDGEYANPSNYYVCSNSYIWDYSLPSDGRNTYFAQMSAATLDGSHYAKVVSPNQQ